MPAPIVLNAHIIETDTGIVADPMGILDLEFADYPSYAQAEYSLLLDGLSGTAMEMVVEPKLETTRVEAIASVGDVLERWPGTDQDQAVRTLVRLGKVHGVEAVESAVEDQQDKEAKQAFETALDLLKRA